MSLLSFAPVVPWTIPCSSTSSSSSSSSSLSLAVAPAALAFAASSTCAAPLSTPSSYATVLADCYNTSGSSSFVSSPSAPSDYSCSSSLDSPPQFEPFFSYDPTTTTTTSTAGVVASLSHGSPSLSLSRSTSPASSFVNSPKLDGYHRRLSFDSSSSQKQPHKPIQFNVEPFHANVGSVTSFPEPSQAQQQFQQPRSQQLQQQPLDYVDRGRTLIADQCPSMTTMYHSSSPASSGINFSASASAYHHPAATYMQPHAPQHQQQQQFYLPQLLDHQHHQQQQQQAMAAYHQMQQHQAAAAYASAAAAAAPVAVAPAFETPQGTFYFVPTSINSNPESMSSWPSSSMVDHSPVQSLQLQQPHPRLSPVLASPQLVASAPAPALIAPIARLPVNASTASGLANVASTYSTSTHSRSPSASVSPRLDSVVKPLRAVAATVSASTKTSTTKAAGSSSKRGRRSQAGKNQTKRFMCPYDGCGRAFARNFNMQSHLKSHLGIREFDCPCCSKKFSRRHDRARHCAAVHDVHNVDDRTVYPYLDQGRTSSLEGIEDDEVEDDDDDEDATYHR